MSALIDAAKTGDLPAFIKAVMKGNADVNEQDSEGRTALHYACMQRNPPLMRYLLLHSELDTNIKDKRGKTALQSAPKEQMQGLTVLFSKAQDRLLRKQRHQKSDGRRKGEEENAEMVDEDAGEDAAVSPSTFRKLIICVVLPFLYLFLRNGIVFSIIFIACSVTFYFISLAYFVSEIAVRPPWYHYQPKATHLVMRGCPNYWQGWINDPKTDFGLPYEDVALESTDGYTLRGWYVPPYGVPVRDCCGNNKSNNTTGNNSNSSSNLQLGDEAPVSPYKYTRAAKTPAPAARRDMGVVLVHGAGRDRRAWERHVPFLSRAGYGCLLIDLREHGLSDGNRRGVTYGMKERYDVISACRFLRTEYGYEKVCAMGTSVGGASVIMAGGIDKSIDAVIAENAMTTSGTLGDQQVIQNFGGYFSHHRYSKVLFRVFRALVTFFLNARIGNVPSKHCEALHCIEKISPRPILLMHGTVDTIVSCKHSQILYDTAKEPKELYLCENAFHCGLYNTKPEEFEDRVLDFLNKYSEEADIVKKPEAEKKDD